MNTIKALDNHDIRYQWSVLTWKRQHRKNISYYNNYILYHLFIKVWNLLKT
jgi:hypothetical protein